MSLGNFLFFWASMACLPLAIILMIVRLNPEIGALRLLVLGGFMLSFGVLTPYWLLRRRARNQMRKIRRALPDALDLLLTAVEAGLGVDAAFALVAERFRGPVGDVFAEYLKQVGLGRSRRAALEDVADRSGVEELIKLAASVAQANEVGTTIGDVLRLQAYELRDHRKRKAQEAAQRAPVWMVIPLALCFMPAMAAVVVVPSILHLLDFVGGLGQ
jgi:tight adherence protein C